MFYVMDEPGSRVRFTSSKAAANFAVATMRFADDATVYSVLWPTCDVSEGSPVVVMNDGHHGAPASALLFDLHSDGAGAADYRRYAERAAGQRSGGSASASRRAGGARDAFAGGSSSSAGGAAAAAAGRVQTTADALAAAMSPPRHAVGRLSSSGYGGSSSGYKDLGSSGGSRSSEGARSGGAASTPRHEAFERAAAGVDLSASDSAARMYSGAFMYNDNEERSAFDPKPWMSASSSLVASPPATHSASRRALGRSGRADARTSPPDAARRPAHAHAYAHEHARGPTPASMSSLSPSSMSSAPSSDGAGGAAAAAGAYDGLRRSSSDATREAARIRARERALALARRFTGNDFGAAEAYAAYASGDRSVDTDDSSGRASHGGVSGARSGRVRSAAAQAAGTTPRASAPAVSTLPHARRSPPAASDRRGARDSAEHHGRVRDHHHGGHAHTLDDSREHDFDHDHDDVDPPVHGGGGRRGLLSDEFGLRRDDDPREHALFGDDSLRLTPDASFASVGDRSTDTAGGGIGGRRRSSRPWDDDGEAAAAAAAATAPMQRRAPGGSPGTDVAPEPAAATTAPEEAFSAYDTRLYYTRPRPFGGNTTTTAPASAGTTGPATAPIPALSSGSGASYAQGPRAVPAPDVGGGFSVYGALADAGKRGFRRGDLYTNDAYVDPLASGSSRSSDASGGGGGASSSSDGHPPAGKGRAAHRYGVGTEVSGTASVSRTPLL